MDVKPTQNPAPASPLPPIIGEHFSLEKELGDQALVREIVRDILETTVRELPTLLDLIAASDFDAGGKLAHRIRGSLLNLAADRICAHLLELETACAASNAQEAQKAQEAQRLVHLAETDLLDLRQEFQQRHSPE
jgi:HPt (histidine-containing phosphotransfer) domain-containing protein